jgi:protein-S-isoprenylcysteine O-methyltransferase Ste14
MQTNEISDVANPGLIRPPIVYTVAVLAGLLIDRFWPVDLRIGFIGLPIGVLALVIFVILIILTRREYRSANTPISGNRPATSVVQTGPFRISRNPFYLAFTLLGISVAFWSNSFWVLVTLVPALAVMQFVVIPREERYMELKFGDEYIAYKSTVRRWL